MKKYMFFFALLAGFYLQAQDLSKNFDAEKYAKDFTEKIITVTEINSDEMIRAVENETFKYAMSIKKHILLFENKGLTDGKSLEEVIEAVKPEALQATKFDRNLKKILGDQKFLKLKDLNLL